MFERVYLLTGSNLGDRAANLKRATEQISNSVGTVLKKSHIYRTAAWGKTDQKDFLNQALEIDTKLLPEVLLQELLLIEKEMGRVRLEKWGERLIDIDILYYGSSVIDIPSLKIPHPHLQDRRFVLTPLCEITPDFIHPIFRKTSQQMLDVCTDPLLVEPFS